MKFFILFLSIFYTSFLSANIVTGVHISENENDYIHVNKEVFKKYRKEKINNFSIKIDINKELLQKEKRYLLVISDIDALKETNVKYENINGTLVVVLDKDTKKNLYFKYKYNKKKIAEFRINEISKFEYDYLLENEGILYGIAYGIIFCAFLYYLIIYFSTYRIYFLYYSLMQLCVLISLFGFVYFSYLSHPNQEYHLAQAIEDIFETAGFLFTMLFAKEILNTKKNLPFMNKVFNIFITLNILDIGLIIIFRYSILYEYMHFYIGFLVPSIAGILSILKGNKYAYIYTIGWLILSYLVYLSETGISFLSGIYIIHLAAPLESLIFSFALGYMLKNLIKEQNEKEKLLIHNSKLASMGEMINNIAHQWRQPLTHLSYINMDLQVASEQKELEYSYLSEKIIESNEQIFFMSNTIDSFRDFYKPDKEKEMFFISTAINKVINIMEPLLKINEIKIEFKIIKDIQIKSYENELSQVILNLISNAKDELNTRKIKNPLISIILESKNNKSFIRIYDNAGGVNPKHINKVFEPYFTTKEEGTGIGLYMSRVIIKSHFKGNLTVENIGNSACFTIKI